MLHTVLEVRPHWYGVLWVNPSFGAASCAVPNAPQEMAGPLPAAC